MKIEARLSRTETPVEGDKRQYFPWKVKWRCPNCGVLHETDFADHYLMKPMLPSMHLTSLYCEDCFFEGAILIKLDLTMEIEDES